jgi:hypothetical protein
MCQYDSTCDNKTEYKDRDIETTQKIKNKYIENKEIIESFISGFRSTIKIYDLGINRLSIKSLDHLLAGEHKLSLCSAYKHLKFTGFPNKGESLMKLIIRKNYEKSGQEYLERLLELITGTSRIPAGGYSLQYPLSMKLIIMNFPPYKAHTCFNYLDISKRYFDEAFVANDIKKTTLYEYFSLEIILNVIKQGFTDV